MPAYLVGHITVVDEQLWREYVAGVAESLLPYPAEILFRGQLDKVLAGQHDHNLVVVIEFANQHDLEHWFHSAKYQSLIALRDRAAKVTITTYQGAPGQ